MTPFANLSAEEAQLALDAVPYVTILIAGADGKIDANETEWASKLTKIRGYAHEEALQEYYDKVGTTFSEKLKGLTNSLPKEVDQRTAAISTELAKLNDIFPKLDQTYAGLLYKSLVTFADHVAKSSGGFLRFGSVSKEEAALIELPMITPVEIPEEDC